MLTRFTVQVIRRARPRARNPRAASGERQGAHRRLCPSTSGVNEPDAPGMVSRQDPGESVIATEYEVVGVGRRYGLQNESVSLATDAPAEVELNARRMARLPMNAASFR